MVILVWLLAISSASGSGLKSNPLTIGSPTVTYSIQSSAVSAVPLVQTAETDAKPATIGTYNTVLNPSNHATVPPVDEIESIAPYRYVGVPARSIYNPKVDIASKSLSSDIFQPIATGAPPSQFAWRSEHFVQRNRALGGRVVQTNKFYTNLLLGSQNSAIFTHPYSIWFRNCTKPESQYCGLSISHVERSQTAYGQGSPARFFINPIGIESLVLSATELDQDTQLLTNNLGAFSLNVHLSANGLSGRPLITFPIVQGMGFVTASYMNATPIVSSGVFFESLVMPIKQPNKQNGIWKYRIRLEDGTTWLMYARSVSNRNIPPFALKDSAQIVGPAGFSGTIQVAKLPSPDFEAVYDASAGTYALSTTVSATASASVGTYDMKWMRGGASSQQLLMFALPHHVESMSAKSRASLTNLTLQTTTKGVARAVLANSITMVEDNMPVNAQFAPWTRPESTVVSQSGNQVIGRAAAAELSQDMYRQTNLTSMYWAGKGFAKFAMAIVAANESGHVDIAAAGLRNLTDAFSIFVENKQRFPLLYETTWRGIVSSASYETNDVFQDYGNSFYNDHHFHYGYFVYTASVIANYDPAWLQMGNNKAYIDSLVRDYANSVSNDPYFPLSRSFDWFHGHSWADGLFEAGDSKNEESTSEDSFSLYAMKMWGKVTGDANMEARGNLQLAILARSLRNYFLMEDDNKNQPPQFIKNKAVGIMFENKVDHATYFGAKPEFVHGIHMLPLHAVSTYTRTPTFVREEWEAYFSNGRAASVEDGAWRNILHANLAMVDSKASWEYFSKPSFDLTTLDTGASLAWYLLFAARLGGVSGK